MKRLMIAFAAVALAAPAAAQVYVPGYTRSDGTYVAPHYRSAPNGSSYDNWSSAPNVNPYTGRVGTYEPYSNQGAGPSSYPSSPYYQGTPARPSYCAYSSYC